MTETQVTPDPRAEYIAGLRMLADVLEAHPELRLPYSGSKASELLVMPVRGSQRDELADWARVLPGRKQKAVRDTAFDFIGSFRGLHIQLICDRDEVCERVVTGTHEVTKEVPDPVALAAVPKVSVTEMVEEVEWICRPVLDSGDPAPVFAELAVAA